MFKNACFNVPAPMIIWPGIKNNNDQCFSRGKIIPRIRSASASKMKLSFFFWFVVILVIILIFFLSLLSCVCTFILLALIKIIFCSQALHNSFQMLNQQFCEPVQLLQFWIVYSELLSHICGWSKARPASVFLDGEKSLASSFSRLPQYL